MELTIWMVDSYVIRPDKLGEFPALLKKLKAFIKKRPELFKEARSVKFFSHMLGGTWGGYVEMYEFENLADFEKCFNRIMQDKEFMTTIYAEFTSRVVPGSESADIWNSVT
jgi:hypothetical protein